MKNNKYYAFITFGHNGVTIKAGEIFDANEVKFSKVDIDFLRSQQKIIAGVDYVIFHPELADEFGLEVAEPVVEESPVIENIEPVVEPLVEQLVEMKQVTPVLVEPVVDEVIDFEPVPVVDEPVEEIVEEVVLESDDEIEVIINESSLNRMKKADLVKLAAKFDIDNPDKLTKTELVKKITEINS